MDLRSLAEVRANPTSKPNPMVDGLLNQGELIIVTGLWDSFKSRFSAELARSIASGEKFLDHFAVARGGASLIIQKEINEGFYDERFLELSRGLSDDTPFYVSYDKDFSFGQGYGKVLNNLIQDLGLKLIVFDPLTYFWPIERTFDENQSGPVAAALAPLLALRNTGCSFVLVHHDPKPSMGGQGVARGSSVLVNAPDARLLLHRKEDNLTVTAKTRNIKGPGKFTATITPEGRLTMNKSGDKQQQEAREWKNKGMNQGQIARTMGISQTTVSRLLKGM